MIFEASLRSESEIASRYFRYERISSMNRLKPAGVSRLPLPSMLINPIRKPSIMSQAKQESNLDECTYTIQLQHILFRTHTQQYLHSCRNPTCPRSFLLSFRRPSSVVVNRFSSAVFVSSSIVLSSLFVFLQCAT